VLDGSTAARWEKFELEIVQLSLPLLRQCPEVGTVDSGYSFCGKFYAAAGGTLRQQWPYDYLAVLLAGEAIARTESGDSAVLVSGTGAVWRSNEAWSLEIIKDARGMTLQGDQLDISLLQRKYSTNSEA
jgi:hypothetical protein